METTLNLRERLFMMNYFNRVVEEIKGMEHFQGDSEFVVVVSEIEKHPSVLIMSDDLSFTFRTYRFDTDVSQFYLETVGRDELHYGANDKYLTLRLYFQTTSQLLDSIDRVLVDVDCNAVSSLDEQLADSLSDEKYSNVGYTFEKGFDGVWCFTVRANGKVIEKYYVSIYKTSDFSDYSFEIFTRCYNETHDPYLPLEYRTYFSITGAAADAVMKVDRALV